MQLAQLASALPFATNLEKVKVITTRGGKSTRDPSYPKETVASLLVIHHTQKRQVRRRW
jgi:hypothetical protein